MPIEANDDPVMLNKSLREEKQEKLLLNEGIWSLCRPPCRCRCAGDYKDKGQRMDLARAIATQGS